MEIIGRAAWGARYPDGFRSAPLPAKEVYLHHSVTTGRGEDAVLALEEIGQVRFGGGISYTFTVDLDGRIYQGHSVGRQGAHTGGRNDISRAICLIGNYETQQMTDAQIRAVAWLLREGKARGWWTVDKLTGGHRDAPGAATACPGRNAYRRINEINRLATSGENLGEDDMTPDQAKKLDVVYETLRRGQANKNPPGEVWLILSNILETAEKALKAAEKARDAHLPGESKVRGEGQTRKTLRLHGESLAGIAAALQHLGEGKADDIAADVAEALKPLIIDAITSEVAPVVRDVLGEDNEDQAAKIVDALSERLAR